MPLTGATPDPDRTVTLTMTVRTDANGEAVQYAIDGTVLTRGGAEGFRWNRHDAEHSLGLGANAARTYTESLKIPCSGVTLAVRVLKNGEWSALETVSLTREPSDGLSIMIQ